jgi:hypothetical protein
MVYSTILSFRSKSILVFLSLASAHVPFQASTIHQLLASSRPLFLFVLYLVPLISDTRLPAIYFCDSEQYISLTPVYQTAHSITYEPETAPEQVSPKVETESSNPRDSQTMTTFPDSSVLSRTISDMSDSMA